MPLFKKRRGPSDISSASKLITGSKIGVGSFGEVFSVCLKKDKKKTTYACKELDSKKIRSQGILTQIRSEKDTMIQIRGHSSIVHLFSYWESPEKVFFLMEYCDAGDMFDRVRNSKRLSLAVCGRYLLQISSALDYVHENRIIYRDLKLENILLKKAGDVALLADFGLSKVMTARDGRTKTICGTIQYMAPELLNDEPYGQGVDWWSLGVMTYVMLTGRYPFAKGVNSLKYDCSASDRVIMYKRISAGMLTFPDFLVKESKPTIMVLKLMMTADEKERATSCARLKETGWLRDIHEVAPAPGPTPTGTSLGKHHLSLPGHAGGVEITKRRSRISRLKSSLFHRRGSDVSASSKSSRSRRGSLAPLTGPSRRGSHAMISPSTLTSDGSLPSSASPLSTPARSRSPLSTAEENGPAPGSATGTAAQMAQAVSVKSDVTAAIWADFAQPTDANGSYLAAVASSDSGGAKRGDKPAPPEVAAAAATSPRKAARPRPLNMEITGDSLPRLAEMSMIDMRPMSVIDFDEESTTEELLSIMGTPEKTQRTPLAEDESLPPTPTADDALELDVEERAQKSPAEKSTWATFGATSPVEDQVVEAPVKMATPRSLEDLRGSNTAIDAVRGAPGDRIFERRATHAAIFAAAAGPTSDNNGNGGRIGIPKTLSLSLSGSAPDLTPSLQQTLLSKIADNDVDESAV